MSLSEMILPEFENEMANTRRTLERVPDEKLDWKPHEKSSSLGGLPTHLANIPSWTTYTSDKDELDIAPPGEPPFRLEQARSTADFAGCLTRMWLTRGRHFKAPAMNSGLETGRCLTVEKRY